jgi:DNA processing protein
METLSKLPSALNQLHKPPEKLFFRGREALLNERRISIVGTRHPSQYSKEMTKRLSQGLAARGVVVVSGAAMGVDALAHTGAFPQTIAVMANSLDISYPAVNKKLIHRLHEEALTLSEYTENTRATKYSFVVRNRIVVALGEALIIVEADENSGTMRSAQIAIELQKPIYVLSQRVGDSLGTQKLVADGHAEIITDVDLFLNRFGEVVAPEGVLAYFQTTRSLKESLKKFGDKIYEWELEGKIIIKNLQVSLS